MSEEITGDIESAGLALIFENFSQEGLDLVVADLREREDSSTLVQIVGVLDPFRLAFSSRERS